MDLAYRTIESARMNKTGFNVGGNEASIHFFRERIEPPAIDYMFTARPSAYSMIYRIPEQMDNTFDLTTTAHWNWMNVEFLESFETHEQMPTPVTLKSMLN